MQAHKLQAKIFFESAVDPEPFVGVFHRWIKEHVLPELLIDVANYAHVPKGPSIALIGHASDYFVDEAEGRPGLLLSRKREPAPPQERVADAFRRLLTAAQLLEREETLAGKLRFRTDELLFRINDRLVAPPGEATFAAVRPELDAVCRKVFAGSYKLALVGSPRELFSVRITSETRPTLEAMLGRL